ncbi:short-chain dehydrogenase/ reductase [Lasiosphaeria miniovina]|uniref:Short-chain dehydrogenase/ reductase n=1 Tax=Lasiosphaeria miniovina TaxID=1954250 RepID=A0AA39ZYE2_9PEZI|nr:short-chain dehydrogenase/ reductase [Lasiosphaeria miniovina]KAK0705940.1 short-chain dehydrogenase/ reductase [Lasiosphaeria miniovina]
MPPYSVETGADQIVANFASEVKSKADLITGVSPNGLGAFFAEAIAKASPKLIILATRNVERASEVAASIKGINSTAQTRILHLDLASLASVRAAAQEVNSYAEDIHVGANNAGIMASNHLGHSLFTNLIMAMLLRSGPAPRVVNVSSKGYRLGGVRHFDHGFHGGASYDPWFAYAASKTANILHAADLARRLGSSGLVAVSLSPGVIYTNLSTHGAMGKFDDLWALLRKVGDPLRWAAPTSLDSNHGVAIHAHAALAPVVKDFNGGYIRSLDTLPDPVEGMSPWAIGYKK